MRVPYRAPLPSSLTGDPQLSLRLFIEIEVLSFWIEYRQPRA